MDDTATTRVSRGGVGVWALRILLGGAFLFFSAMKLSGQPRMVAEFDTVGLGQWFRYFTGSLELIGGLAILVPRISILGAAVLLLVDLGAFVAQVTVLHMDWVHCVVIGALLVLTLYLQAAKRSSSSPTESNEHPLRSYVRMR